MDDLGVGEVDSCLHVCVDRRHDVDPVRSWYEATKERPSNTFPVIQRAARSEPMEIPYQRLGVFVDKHWEAGQVLPVSFVPGTPRSLIVKLMTMANETGWPGNLKYRDVPVWDQGEIRIAFVPNEGSYSMIGTDCRAVPLHEKTMNLGWINLQTDDREVFRTFVHELGHSRGYPHNQSLPNFNLPLRREYMIQWYMQTQGWSRQDAEAQFEQIAASQLQFSPTNDLESLMQYPIPDQFVTTGHGVPMNFVLSAEDKRFDLQVYPFKESPTDPTGPPPSTKDKILVVGAPPVSDSIAARKEVDWWSVKIPDLGTYRFRVEPAMVLGLFNADKTQLLTPSTYGPTSQRTDLISYLDSGDYVLGVKHHFASGIGPYRIAVVKVG